MGQARMGGADTAQDHLVDIIFWLSRAISYKLQPARGTSATRDL